MVMAPMVALCSVLPSSLLLQLGGVPFASAAAAAAFLTVVFTVFRNAWVHWNWIPGGYCFRFDVVLVFWGSRLRAA